LLLDLAGSACISDVSTETALLVSLLTPLEFMSGKKDVLKQESMDMIVSTCFSGLCHLIRRSKATDGMVRTLLDFVLKNVFADSVQHPDSVQGSAKALLRECLIHASITAKDRRRISLDLAKSGKWDAWGVVFSVDEGRAASQSLEVASSALSNVDNSVSQLAALAAVRSIIQSCTPPSASIGRLMRIVGADVLGILYSYGTCSVPSNALASRQTACADAMKTTLVTFQQISSDAMKTTLVTFQQISSDTSGDDGPIVQFLSVFFEMLLAVMRFNGLPNHPSPQALGDPALGRMSAQAVLHSARTAPAPFKTCVAELAEHDRTLLEFAVRAEMTGYQVQSQHAPEKKKLNLNNFKKV
jgi:ABC-type transporter Mla MlaB component